MANDLSPDGVGVGKSLSRAYIGAPMELGRIGTFLSSSIALAVK